MPFAIYFSATPIKCGTCLYSLDSFFHSFDLICRPHSLTHWQAHSRSKHSEQVSPVSVCKVKWAELRCSSIWISLEIHIGSSQLIGSLRPMMLLLLLLLLLMIWAYRGVVIITAVVVVVVVENLGHSVSMLGKITVVLRCWWKRQLLRIVRPPRPVILINWLQVTAKKRKSFKKKKKCQKPCSTKLHVFRPFQVVAVQVNFPRVFFSFDFQMVSTSFRVLWPPRMEIQEASLYAKGSYKKCVKMQRIEFQVFHVPPPWYVFDKALRCAALFHSIAVILWSSSWLELLGYTNWIGITESIKTNLTFMIAVMDRKHSYKYTDDDDDGELLIALMMLMMALEKLIHEFPEWLFKNSINCIVIF